MSLTWKSGVVLGGLSLLVTSAVTMTPVSAQATRQGTQGVASRQVTFTKDVAPIFQRSCQSCHRPGQIAPMSLLTYQEARPWARSIRNKVVNREMPPWHIDRNVGISKFKDDPSLTDAEVKTIAAWVDAGAPIGSPADMPPALQFADDMAWFIGKPDIIVKMEKPYMLAAAGPDNIVDVLIDPGFTEDMYVMAIESKPLDPRSFKVVHHFTTNLVEDPEEDPDGLFLNEYALGKNGDIFPPNSGRLIKAGTKINFNLHLNPRGEATPVAVQLGLKLCRRARFRSTWRSRSTWVTSANWTSRPARSRGTTGISGCRSRRCSRHSSRTCTTGARRSAWKRSIRTCARTRRVPARRAWRRLAA